MQTWVAFVYNKYKGGGGGAGINPESVKIYIKENPVNFDRL